MSKVVEFFHKCMVCGRKFNTEEYRQLPTTRLEGGKIEWPTCPCGNYELKFEDDSDDED